MGGTGLEPVIPSLSIRGNGSRPFAQVRSTRIHTRFRPVDQTGERTRANAECRIAATATAPGRLDPHARVRVVSLRRRRGCDAADESRDAAAEGYLLAEKADAIGDASYYGDDSGLNASLFWRARRLKARMTGASDD